MFKRLWDIPGRVHAAITVHHKRWGGLTAAEINTQKLCSLINFRRYCVLITDPLHQLFILFLFIYEYIDFFTPNYYLFHVYAFTFSFLFLLSHWTTFYYIGIQPVNLHFIEHYILREHNRKLTTTLIVYSSWKFLKSFKQF